MFISHRAPPRVDRGVPGALVGQPEIAASTTSKRPLDCANGLGEEVVGAARPLPLVIRLPGAPKRSSVHAVHDGGCRRLARRRAVVDHVDSLRTDRTRRPGNQRARHYLLRRHGDDVVDPLAQQATVCCLRCGVQRRHRRDLSARVHHSGDVAAGLHRVRGTRRLCRLLPHQPLPRAGADDRHSNVDRLCRAVGHNGKRASSRWPRC